MSSLSRQRRHAAMPPGRAPYRLRWAAGAAARGRACHQAFHDVLTGDNSVMLRSPVLVGYQAGPGWDPVTGWGSPRAQALVPLLARHSQPSIPHF